ncbi:hypothetical protein DYB32_007863 [Aphanomyces invadans]|uniref:Uncharacterized protein n=1 Tax=Aphanomyces invadans TaxID=157072 RepID=A0A418ALD0_9STRA|nr:hypothetical protein DYB32_009803 [Aphanomyces invadans]RHY25467.1 hypothetical protein DYB32_008292 [Aphanomyces invadans]RHY26111.1 hypothetical protein DYB32_007863 [Aphanomyces invadans]
MARSPPPYAKDAITACLSRYSSLLDRRDAKTNAVARLETRPPASIHTKIDFRLSTALKEAQPDAAAALHQRFADTMAQRQGDLHALILDAARAELAQVNQDLQECVPTTVADLKRYFECCANVCNLDSIPDANPRAAPLAGTQGSRAAGHAWNNKIFFDDFILSVDFLDAAIKRLHYTRTLAAQQKQFKADKLAAAKHAAETMEVNLPNDLLVGQLVKRAVEKETAVLRKEINHLRASLKAATGRPGGPTGKTQMSSPPPPRNGGENPSGGAAGSKFRKKKSANANASDAKHAAAPKPRGQAPSKKKATK